ncbi:MAG: DUF547 domain-containing protein [Oligoflexales bacterium]|nr:DUF547 domain-containing protein [Oligoflexales bacterium]
MQRLFKLSFMLLLVNVKALAFDHEHQEWSQILRAYLNEESLVDYSALKQNSVSLKAYLSQLEAVNESEYSSWAVNEQKAFLINAYNAFTVKLIIDHYPVKSIRKIGGIFSSPWKKKFFKLLNGRIKTLDQIEHDELRSQFEDFRIHAAVNCASKSCPPLRSTAFTANNLDAELDAQMQLWLSDPSRNEFDPEVKKINLSMIFKWYRSDFDNWGGGLDQVLRRFGPPEASDLLADDASISYLTYDWSLNDSK